jgi:hypothetical protein
MGALRHGCLGNPRKDWNFQSGTELLKNIWKINPEI